MMFHLEHEHKEVLKSPGLGQKTKPQPKINTAWQGGSGSVRPLTALKRSKVNAALVDFVIDRLLPFSVVDHDSFKRFVNELDDRYVPPGRKFIVTEMDKLYRKVRCNLETSLKDVDDVAITHDAWTSLNTQSYDTVTVHYISSTWNLKSAVLDTSEFPGSHTGENIAKKLMDTISEWKLPIPIAVTDNAANEKKAFELLGWTRIGCYGHRINLVVKHALAINEVARLIAKGRSVVTFFHQSPLACGVLEMKQKLLLEEKFHGLKLIQDVATRWNSTYDMLVRLSQQMPALHAAVMDPAIGKRGQELKFKLYSFDDQVVIDSLVTVLEPFKTATVLLSGEKNPTFHLVIPTLKKLEQCLRILMDTDKPIIKKLKTDMQLQLNLRTLDRKIALIACFLSPSTKQLSFVPDDREDVHKWVHEEMCEINEGRCKKFKKEADESPSESDVDSAMPDLPTSVPTMPSLPNLSMSSVIDSDSDTDPFTPPSRASPSSSLPTSAISVPTVTEPTEMDWLSDIICTGSSSTHFSNEEMCQKELDRYVSDNQSDSVSVSATISTDLLGWWKEKECLYPKLSIVAKKYLAIPSSSVPSERIFSLAGSIVSKKRSQLSPDNVNKMIFLNKNKKEYSN